MKKLKKALATTLAVLSAASALCMPVSASADTEYIDTIVSTESSARASSFVNPVQAGKYYSLVDSSSYIEINKNTLTCNLVQIYQSGKYYSESDVSCYLSIDYADLKNHTGKKVGKFTVSGDNIFGTYDVYLYADSSNKGYYTIFINGIPYEHSH